MAQISDLEKRFCVVWKIRIPCRGTIKSCEFPFQGFHWNLAIRMFDDTYFFGEFENFYEISLYTSNKKGAVSRDLCKQFTVTTLLESEGNDKVSHICSVTTVKSIHGVLWDHFAVDAWKLIPELKYGGAWKIVCMFHDFPPSEFQSNKETVHVSTQCDLRSPDFPPDLENPSLDYRKLLNDKVFPDVKLKCGNRTISAHWAVLVARSEVFAAMFRNKMAQRKTGVIDVTDLDAHVLDLLLEFMYSGKVRDKSEDTLPRLYAASDKYAVHALKKACSDWMIRSLTEENYVRFLTVADMHSDASFKDAVIAFICNRGDFLENEVWLRFSEEHPKLAIGVYQRFLTSKNKKKSGNQSRYRQNRMKPSKSAINLSTETVSSSSMNFHRGGKRN